MHQVTQRHTQNISSLLLPLSNTTMCHGLPFKPEEPVICIKTQTMLEVR